MDEILDEIKRLDLSKAGSISTILMERLTAITALLKQIKDNLKIKSKMSWKINKFKNRRGPSDTIITSIKKILVYTVISPILWEFYII